MCRLCREVGEETRNEAMAINRSQIMKGFFCDLLSSLNFILKSWGGSDKFQGKA